MVSTTPTVSTKVSSSRPVGPAGRQRAYNMGYTANHGHFEEENTRHKNIASSSSARMETVNIKVMLGTLKTCKNDVVIMPIEVSKTLSS